MSYSLEEVAKHTAKDDCWVVVNGEVLDVTKFLPDHPGGELAILTFAGKDASEEFNMIHPPDVVGKYAPDAVIGKVGAAGAAVAAAPPAAAGGGGGASLPPLPSGMSYYPLSEVAKHTTDKDCWVVVNGEVLDVTKFLPDHPGGALAILTFAGKDATEEFNMIHPPDVIGKYAPDAVIGKVGEAAAAAPAAGAGGLAAPLLQKGGKAGDTLANEHSWGGWRDVKKAENPGVLYISVWGWIHAAMCMASSFLLETIVTIFSVSNFKFTNDRTGLTRSAILLILFMVIHAVGNLHIFLGPDDFNGYGYFYVRLYWTMLGIVKANIVEVYIAFGAVLHVMVALKRTWDINRNYTLSSGKMNLAMTGVLLLTFMIIHLYQFRFGATQMYLVRPPPYLINFWGILKLQLFWTDDPTVTPVPVRDIYKLEFDLFQDPVWVAWYMFSVGVFLVHACLGWAKLVPSTGFKIPKVHHTRVIYVGYVIFAFIALCYFSFPMYCFFGSMKKGNLGAY